MEWVDESVTKRSLDRAYLVDGEGAGAELELTLDSRGLPWVIDLEKEARKLSICESAAMLLWDVQNKQWRPRTYGCNSMLCPVCMRVRAARACGRWRAVLEAAAADGAVIRHWTLTQPVDMAPGGLVTPPEWRRGWRGTLAADGVVARAVGGEGLLAGYLRIRDALRAGRDSQRTRQLFREAFGGFLTGFEWTGRDRDTGTPRYHVHLHLLGCTPPEVVVDEDAVLDAWCELTGGSRRAQHVRIVDPDSVSEVLKYPFKPGFLTSAQRIESMAAMKGMHAHHTSGSWASQSRARKEDERWNRWLSARPPTPVFRRLYLDEGDEEPSLWTGDPRQGHHTFAMKSATGGWIRWVADAAVYASLLGEDLPPEFAPEPGEDRADEWFSPAAD